MNLAPHELALVNAAAGGFGMPDERLARVAARRAFVEIKHSFMRATQGLQGPGAADLHHKVRQAGEAIELWLLRHAVLDALAERAASGAAHRAELMRQLDSVFPSIDADLPGR